MYLKEIHAWGKIRILNDNIHVPRSLSAEEWREIHGIKLNGWCAISFCQVKHAIKQENWKLKIRGVYNETKEHQPMDIKYRIKCIY